MKNCIVALAAALTLAACATTSTTETAQSTSPSLEKEYRTGSRIPVKDPAATAASPARTLDPAALGSGAPVRTN